MVDSAFTGEPNIKRNDVPCGFRGHRAADADAYRTIIVPILSQLAVGFDRLLSVEPETRDSELRTAYASWRML